MRLFHPLGFMLASPVETPEEAVERFTAKPAKAPKPPKEKKARKGRQKAGAEEAAAAGSEDEAFADAPEMDVNPAGGDGGGVGRCCGDCWWRGCGSGRGAGIPGG